MAETYYDQINKAKKKIIRRYYKRYYQKPKGIPPLDEDFDAENPNWFIQCYGLWLASLKFVENDEGMPFSEYYWAFNKLAEKYPELMTHTFQDVYPNGGPKLPYTIATQILLQRGFKHIVDQRPYLDNSLYSIYSSHLGLVWPEQYKHHQDACQAAIKFGLPNHTTCPALELQKTLYTRNY